MTVDRRAFLADQCREHLEEASFLYSQRQQIIASEHGRWRAGLGGHASTTGSRKAPPARGAGAG